MFNIFKKQKQLLSVANGRVIPLSKVPDQVFSQKILGDGFAVIPTNGEIFSPASGKVTDITDTRHAYCITTDDGLEILVHIGIDTVELKGQGFTPLVKIGDKISAGDEIAKADLELIKSAGYNTSVVVIITNSDRLRELNINEAPSSKAGSVAATYKL